MAQFGAIGQSVPYYRNGDKDSSSGLVLPGDNEPGRTCVLEGDFLVRARGERAFHKGFACIVLAEWRRVAGTSIDPLDEYVRKAVDAGKDAEEAECEYNRMLVDMADIVVVKANGTGDPNISIVESGSFEYSTQCPIKPRGNYRFYFPTRAERKAMAQTGDKLAKFRAYYGAPILREIPAAEHAASSDLHALFARFFAMPDKLQAFDRLRQSNFSGDVDQAVLVPFQILLNFFTMAPIFNKLTGLTNVPTENIPAQAVAGNGNSAIVGLAAQYAIDTTRDTVTGVFNLDATDGEEAAASVRGCYYASGVTVAPASAGEGLGTLRPRINPDEFFASTAMYLGLISPDDETEKRVSEEVLSALCREMFKPYYATTPAAGTDYASDSSVTPHSRIGVVLDAAGKFVQDISQVTNGDTQSFDPTSRIGRLALAAQANGLHGLSHSLYVRGARSTASTKVIASPSCNSVGNGNSAATYSMRVTGH